MSGFKRHIHRVAVPLEVRTCILKFRTRRDACKLLGISDATYDEVVSPQAMLRPSMLAKIVASLAEFMPESSVSRETFI